MSRHLRRPTSPVDIGFDRGKIRTKLENGSYDAESNGEQHIKSPRKISLGKIF